MAWSAPSSVTTGDLITAATWNQDVVDNAQFLYDKRIIAIRGTDRRSASYRATTSNSTYTSAICSLWWPGDKLTLGNLSVYFAFVGAIDNAATTGVHVVYAAGTAIASGSVGFTNVSSSGSVQYSAEVSGDAAFPAGTAQLQLYHKSTDGVNNSRIWDFDVLAVG